MNSLQADNYHGHST